MEGRLSVRNPDFSVAKVAPSVTNDTERLSLAVSDGMSFSDEQCVRRCLNGHPEEFRHLVDRYQSALARCLRVRLGNADEAAEVAQESFVRAYFDLGRLRKPAAFFAWVWGIADRVVKEARRAPARRRFVAFEQAEEAELDAKSDPDDDIEVSLAVARLPEPYREVVLLRFYGGRSCAQISEDLDVPLGTVTKRLSRAYTLLRELLHERCRGGVDEVTR